MEEKSNWMLTDVYSEDSVRLFTTSPIPRAAESLNISLASVGKRSARLTWSPASDLVCVWDTSLYYRVQVVSVDGRLVWDYSAYEHQLGVRSCAWSPDGCPSALRQASRVTTLPMDAVRMGSLRPLVHLMRAAWNTKHARTRGMDAAETASQLLRGVTLRDVPRMYVRKLSLVAAMTERQQQKVLERTASAMKTRNVKLASLAAVLMEGKQKTL